MATNLLRLPAVMARTGLPRSSIYERMARGDFPRPITLGKRTVAWLESDIDAWIATQVKAARQGAVSPEGVR